MAQFSYLARNSSGTISRGTLQSASADELRQALRNRGLRLLSVQEKFQPQSAWSQLRKTLDFGAWLPPRSIHVEVLLEQLAVMLRSGLELVTALQTLSTQAETTALRRICRGLIEEVRGGDSLAEAMSRHRAFPPIAVQLVRVGEATGKLDLVLDRAAAYMARSRKTLVSVLSALAYPLVVAAAAIGVSAYLVICVIPELAKFLRAMGRTLPAITQSLLDVSDGIVALGPAVVALFATALIGLGLVYFWPPGRLQIDRCLLRVPVLGRLLRMSGTVTFASSLSVMLRSGVTLKDSLETIAQLHRNRFLASRVELAKESVVRGTGLASPLAAPHGHTPMLSSMIAVGEQSGEMDEVLEQVAGFHESQLESSLKRFSALIEPAIIVVVGGVVGYVYLAFFVALIGTGGNI